LGYAVLLGWAVLGTVLSAALHAYAFTAGYRPLTNTRTALFTSAVLLIVTGLIDRQRLRRRGAPRGWWKAAEAASPYWLRWVSRAVILYMAAFVAYDTFTALRSTITPEAALRGADRILGALFMAFHAITFTLVYTLRIASRQAKGRAGASTGPATGPSDGPAAR
jgi:hypothetical protein